MKEAYFDPQAHILYAREVYLIHCYAAQLQLML